MTIKHSTCHTQYQRAINKLKGKMLCSDEAANNLKSLCIKKSPDKNGFIFPCMFYAMLTVSLLITLSIRAFAHPAKADCLYNETKKEIILLEELEYRLLYAKLPAGILSLQKLHGTDSSTFEIVARARSISVYDRIFHVDNVYRTVVDTSRFLSSQFEKCIRQKNIKQNMTVHFDRECRNAQTSDSLAWAIDDSTRDFVALLFYLRKYLLKSGERRRLCIDAEGITWEVLACHTGFVPVRTPVGRYSTAKVVLLFERPSSLKSGEWKREWETDIITNRLSKQGVKVSIWFTIDHRRLPVQIAYHSSPFSVHLVLIKYSGTQLKHDTHD